MSPPAANVHKALFDVIQFSKRQQWAITNYVVLVYGAIFGLSKALDSISKTEKWGLAVLTGIALVGAAWMLVQIQRDMGRARTRLELVSKEWLSDDERDALGIKEYGTPWRRGISFLTALISVATFGAFLVIYSLLR